MVITTNPWDWYHLNIQLALHWDKYLWINENLKNKLNEKRIFFLKKDCFRKCKRRTKMVHLVLKPKQLKNIYMMNQKIVNKMIKEIKNYTVILIDKKFTHQILKCCIRKNILLTGQFRKCVPFTCFSLIRWEISIVQSFWIV